MRQAAELMPFHEKTPPTAEEVKKEDMQIIITDQETGEEEKMPEPKIEVPFEIDEELKQQLGAI